MWVDHMVDHFSTYIYQKRGFFYFSKRIPKQVRQSHGKQRIVFALNTRSRASAIKYAQVICQRLDERWLPMKIISSSVRIKFGHQDRLKLGSVDSSRDWSSAKDIVSALYAIMDNGALNQDFVLGSGFTMQVSDLLEIAFKRLGLRWQDYVDVEKSEGRVNDILGFSADITKAKKELNWEPQIEPKEWVSEIQDFYLEKIERC